MNKPIDDLFEQARQSFRADMPLQDVEALLHRTAVPTSFWTWKKISSCMSITGIITVLLIGTFYAVPSDKSSVEQPMASLYENNTPTFFKEPPLSHLLPFSSELLAFFSDSIPPIQKVPPAPPSTPARPPASSTFSPAPPAAPSHLEARPKVAPTPLLPPRLDSFGPKKTFTEYTLEIRKDNSEQELQNLKQELQRYGIQLQIQQLTYNRDQTIKRFKGRFETDSLFCSTAMSEHEFDIQGAFKSMQFTFRVANEKKLKYLKIQSDNFENVIECYDDQVLTNSVQAMKAAQAAERQMHLVQLQAQVAQRHLQLAQQETARSRANLLRLQADSLHINLQRHYLDSLPRRHWSIANGYLFDSVRNIKVYFENFENQLESLDRLADKDWFATDSAFFKLQLKDKSNELRFQLDNMRLDLERGVEQRFEFSRDKEQQLQRFLERSREQAQSAQSLKEEAERLEKEAALLEKAAKELRKAAKRRSRGE